MSTINYKPIYMKNISAQTNTRPITINTGETMTSLIDWNNIRVLGTIQECKHDFKELMVNLKLFKECKKCNKRIHIKDLKHWGWKKQ